MGLRVPCYRPTGVTGSEATVSPLLEVTEDHEACLLEVTDGPELHHLELIYDPEAGPLEVTDGPEAG